MLTVGHAFVALGANLPAGTDSPVLTLHKVLPELATLSRQPLIVSGFYRSAPKDCPPGSPEYANAVAALAPLPEDDPFTLLEKLQAIERRHGRVRSGLRNAARTLDLDLLAFGTVQCTTPALVLPHPRAHQRRFVLEPWQEIAGSEWLLAGRPLGQWIRECSDPPLQRIAT
jgi:2-amino-4-hydroxy-6-hydroxymethyldihydropteridine diphosphokinase